MDILNSVLYSMLQVAPGPQSCLKLLWFALQAQTWLARSARHSQTPQAWLVHSVVLDWLR